MVGHSMEALTNRPFLVQFQVQNYAVVVFFVLSGFLICWSAVKKRDYSFGEYFIDRAARIFVAFVPAVILTLLLDAFTGAWGPRNGVGSFVANMLMLQGIPFDRIVPGIVFYSGYGSNSPLWTVAVEWWLYMAFGVIYFSSRLRGWEIPGAAVLAVPALGVILLYSLSESLSTTWIISALLAIPIVLLSSENAKRFAWAALLLSLILCAARSTHLSGLAPFPSYDAQLMLVMTFAILSAIAALKSVDRQLLGFLSKPINWLSDISYSLYLIHYPILVAFLHYMPPGWALWQFVLYNCVGLLSAWIFTLLFDTHYARVAKFAKSVIWRRPAAVAPQAE